MRTRPFFVVLLAALAAVPACKSPRPEAAPTAARTRILKEIPRFPGSVLTDTAGTGDAERQSWLARVPFDSLRTFYRNALPGLGWVIQSEQGDTAKLDLYARKGIQTLWLHAEKVGSLASEYTLIATDAQPPPAQTRPRL